MAAQRQRAAALPRLIVQDHVQLGDIFSCYLAYCHVHRCCCNCQAMSRQTTYATSYAVWSVVFQSAQRHVLADTACASAGPRPKTEFCRLCRRSASASQLLGLADEPVSGSIGAVGAGSPGLEDAVAGG